MDAGRAPARHGLAEGKLNHKTSDMLDLTVLIPIGNERVDSTHWLPLAAAALQRLGLAHEIVLVGAGALRDPLGQETGEPQRLAAA